jgi:hypothetical protein
MDSAAHGPDQPEAAPECPEAAAAHARRAELVARLDRMGVLGMGMAEISHKFALCATERDHARLDALPPDAAVPPAESNGPTLSFARASAVVQDCIAMELKLTGPLEPARKAELAGRLDLLGLMGMALAEATQTIAVRAVARDMATLQAMPPDAIAPRAESNGLARSFTRASRVVQGCIEMELKITAPPAARRGDQTPRLGASARKRLNAMKNEVRQHVEKSIRTNAETRDVDHMLFALDARLDAPEVEAQFGKRTLGQIVLSVCRDVDVDPDLTGWSDDMLHTAYAAVRNWEWKPPAPTPKHGRAIGLKPDPTIEKLPTGVIGTPGVPPAMDVPPWPHPAPPQQTPPAPVPAPAPASAPAAEPLRNGHAPEDAPAAPRRPPGVFFSR